MSDKKYFMVGFILDKIYKSEINFSLGWMWDGGIDFQLCDLVYQDTTNVVLHSTDCDEICEAIVEIADVVANKYPRSEFAKWWADQNYRG